MNKTKYVIYYSERAYECLGRGVEAVIKTLQEARDEALKDGCKEEDITVEYDAEEGYYDSIDVQIMVRGIRPMTQEELDEEAKVRENARKKAEERDRREFERLKLKLEGKGK